MKGTIHKARELIWTARPADAERLLRSALPETQSRDDQLILQTLLAESLMLQGRLSPTLLEQLERQAREQDGIASARALGVVARGWTQIGDNERADATGRAALERNVSGDAAVRSNALIAISASLFDAARIHDTEKLTREAAELAETVDDPDARRTNAHFFHGVCRMWLDDFQGALDAWLVGEEMASEAGDRTVLPLCFFVRGYLLFLQGRLQDAEAEIETALRVAHEIGTVAYDVTMEATMARVHLHLARFKKAGDLLAEVESDWHEADYIGDAGLSVYQLRAEVREAEQDHAQALQDLLTAVEIKGHHQRVLSRIMFGPAIVRLAMSQVEKGLAVEWADYTEAAARSLRTSFATGMARRARALANEDPYLLESALESLQRTPRGLSVAQTQEELGQMLEGEAAIRFCRAALASYDGMGAERDSWRVLARLRELGVRQGVAGPRDRPALGPASLTRTEQRVADLMCDGHSYPEIGKRLFISHRTVETHAAHIFQKLGIESRKELPDALS